MIDTAIGTLVRRTSRLVYNYLRVVDLRTFHVLRVDLCFVGQM